MLGGPHLVLTIRNLFYLILAVTLIIFNEFIFISGSSINVFLGVATVILMGHLVFAFLSPTHKNMFAFFLADLFVALLVVRQTGASASPFVVLYPIVVLVASILFEELLAGTLVVMAMLLMALSVGFSVAIIGNAVAILSIGFLGLYLKRTLSSTDRQLQTSELARKRLENLQRAIITNIPSGLMSIDTEGRIIQVNQAGAAILGFAEDGLLGQKLTEVLPELDSEIRKLNTRVPVIEGGVQNAERPTVEYVNNGRRLQLGYSAARLTDPADGTPLGTLLIFQDLTRVLELEGELRRSERLAAVGKLAASIAHEFRNPLASISGSAQLLGHEKKLSQDDQHLLSIIQKESRRLDNLINDFLDYVRTPKPKVENVDLAFVAQNLRDSLMVNPKWPQEKCQLELYLPQNECLILGDADKVNQVLSNLLMNAAQAGATRVLLLIECLDSQVVCSIKDNGHGISDENKKRLFEPFFTTKEGGTGLGLAICHKILESMQARISVESPLPSFCEKGGTMFKIIFRRGAHERSKQAAS